jgi:hypothetical protein
MNDVADESAWLIERADPQYPGCVLAGNFLGVQGSYDGQYGSGKLCWLPRADDALRFSRQKDAAMFIGAMSALMDYLPHGDTIPGLRSGEPRAIAVPHAWGKCK